MAGCVLAYPSYPTDVPDTVEDRLGHCLALRERHGMEVAPIDVATVNLVLWDKASGTVGPTESLGALDVIRNSMPFVTAALGRYREVRAEIECGKGRHEPQLELHLRQLPASIDVEWILVPYNIADRGLVEALARAALERGGGIRLGIGDNPVAFADLDNARVVDLGVGWARTTRAAPSRASATPRPPRHVGAAGPKQLPTVTSRASHDVERTVVAFDEPVCRSG
jgi:hypothetical protein